MIDRKQVIGFSNSRTIVLLVLFTLLETINIVFMESSLNLILTVPQIIIVLYYLYAKNDLYTAFLLHIIFILTGLDATSGSSEMQLMSYAKVKLFGPLTMSYIILGLIWLRTISLPIICKNNSLLLLFRKTLLFLLLSGVIIGIPGLFLFNHRLSDFILPFIYTFVGFLYADVFVRLCGPGFLNKCSNYAYTLLLSAPYATFITFFLLGIRAEYSVLDALIFNELFIMAPILIVFLLFNVRSRLLLLLSLAVYGMCVAAAGRGGMFLNILVASLFAVYYIYFDKGIRHKKSIRVLRIVIPILVIYGIIHVGVIEIEGGQSLAGNKINELVSLIEAAFMLRSTSFQLTDVAASPYIRIAEVLNVLDNGFKEPLCLIFGHGFGGVYTDSTRLFENVDVSAGGFPMEVVNSGKFGTAHSFLPTTLLYNGLIGLFLIFYLGIKYIRKCKFTPFVYAAYILCFYSFYFNTSLLIASSFALFCAEYWISGYDINKYYENNKRKAYEDSSN